ncbi:MAG: hypothetical protein V1875_00690 [Candidatus Altiarchaeota archaeon]
MLKMTRGQVTVEFMLSLSLATLIFLVSINFIAQGQRSAAQSLWSIDAQNRAQEISDNYNSVYLAGSGSRLNMTLPVRLVGGVNYTVTVDSRLVTVKVPAYGAEFERKFINGQVAGSKPPFPIYTGGIVTLTNDNGTVRAVSFATSTTTTSTTSTTTTLPPTTCDGYCRGIQEYSGGTCRQNPSKCPQNGEVHEAGGDGHCATGKNTDTCCCLTTTTTTTSTSTTTTIVQGVMARVSPQSCNAAIQEATAGSFPDQCEGLYPGACPGDRVTCDDNQLEAHRADAGEYCGVMLTYRNTSVADCNTIKAVTICFEWWSMSRTPSDCHVGVSKDGAAWEPADIVCHAAANPGLTCVDVTASAGWSCSDFFGASADGAYARQYAKHDQNNKQCRIDILYYDVTYV